MTYIVFKINRQQLLRRLSTNDSLAQILSGNWRITPQKVKNANRALAVFSGVIVAEFKVDDSRYVHMDDHNKLSFNLQQIPESVLIGRTIQYPTSNSASVITKEKLAHILQKEEHRYE